METSDEDLQSSILSTEASMLLTNRSSEVVVEDYMDNKEEVPFVISLY